MKWILIAVSWPIVGLGGTIWSVQVHRLGSLRWTQWLLGIALGWLWPLMVLLMVLSDAL